MMKYTETLKNLEFMTAEEVQVEGNLPRREFRRTLESSHSNSSEMEIHAEDLYPTS